MAGGCAVESGAPTPMPILCKFMEMDANQPPSSMKPHGTAWNRSPSDLMWPIQLDHGPIPLQIFSDPLRPRPASLFQISVGRCGRTLA